MKTKNKPLPAREMHKIVWVGVGVLTLFFVTYPIAMWRVSQKEKFFGSHIKSLTIEGKNPADAPATDVTTVANKSAETAIASSPTDKTVQALPVPAGKQEVQAVDETNQTAEITDRTKLDELALKVYDRINQTWQTTPTFTQNLVYRVSASQDGAIGNFEPLNQPAKDFTQETPLPNLLKSAETTSSSATPFAKLTVVFAPTGTLEVNP